MNHNLFICVAKVHNIKLSAVYRKKSKGNTTKVTEFCF